MVALLESVWAAASLGGGELKGVPSIKQADRIGINSCCSGGCYFDGLPSCFAAWVREASRCGHRPVPEPCGLLHPRHLERCKQYYPETTSGFAAKLPSIADINLAAQENGLTHLRPE